MMDLPVSMEDIFKLMEAMAKNRLTSFKLELGDFELELESNPTTIAPAPVPAPQPPAFAEAVPPAVPTFQEPPAPIAAKGTMVKAPIVGTFYSAAAPDQPAFVQVGSKVQKGDVLFIIESMKLMNEVVSEWAGEVLEILVGNSEVVEYGQPILVIG